MLIGLGDIRRARVAASDGRLGALRDAYFDDSLWKVRFFIVATRRFLGRNVLIVPDAVTRVDHVASRLELALTREQVEGSPPVEAARPVSRQKAEEYEAYYGWPYFRSAPAARGRRLVRVDAEGRLPIAEEDQDWDPHLRGFAGIVGYRIHARDHHVGHLEDMLVDDREWAVRYLVVNPRSWWPGKKVLIPPGATETFDWQHRAVMMDLPGERIRQAPPWTPGTPLERHDERRIHTHYGLPPYWGDSTGEQPGGAPA